MGLFFSGKRATIRYMELISKEQFLEKHNRLSPVSLQANLTLLDRFKEEKKPQLKDDSWCLDKFRIPFITWLTSVKTIKKNSSKPKKLKKKTSQKSTYRNYPETHYES